MIPARSLRGFRVGSSTATLKTTSMQRSQPFARALALAASIGAIMSQAAAGAMSQIDSKIALSGLGSYESNGKGGKHPHRRVGTKANKRASIKARNVRRNRLAHRC